MPGVRSTAPNGLAMDGQHRTCKRSRMRERRRASVAYRDVFTAPHRRSGAPGPVAGKAATKPLLER